VRHEEIHQNAILNPDKCAIVFNEKKISYRELDEMSNSLGWYLREQGIRRNDIVPIISERSYYYIVAMLGIFNLGTWFFGIPILAVGIVLLVFSFKKMKKFSDEYWSERSAANEKCEEILNKARSVKNEKVKEETV